MEVASKVVANYPDGVWLIELASLSDPSLIPQTVASALGLRERSDQPILSVLKSFLQARHCLLVWDNCEHLVGACAQLANSLLQVGPQLTILATSRQALQVFGEVQWRVPSLRSPDPTSLSSSPIDRERVLSEYPAIQLFVERARSVQPDLVTTQNLRAIADICWRLDGMPLAIELAAARVHALSIETIAARLDQRFELLTSGNRVALPRQQTLRATIDWSYDLLTESERALLRRLAVFAGSFTLEAVEFVGFGDGIEANEILDLLARLVEKSLVVAEDPHGEHRFRLLETIRSYAIDKLGDTDETGKVRRRHAEWCSALAKEAEPELAGRRQAWWAERLHLEMDNLRAALAWYRNADPIEGLRLAMSIWRFWLNQTLLTEGSGCLRGLLVRFPERTRLRAQALYSQGYLDLYNGVVSSAASEFEESLTIFQEIGDDVGVGIASRGLAQLASTVGDYPKARALFENAVTRLRAARNIADIGLPLLDFGILMHRQGNREQAMSLYQDALSAFRAAQDAWGVAFSLRQIGDLQILDRDLADGRASLGQSMKLAQEIKHSPTICAVLVSLAKIARAERQFPEARVYLDESVTVCRASGQRVHLGITFYEMGRLAQAEGDYEPAEAHFKASLAEFMKDGDRVEKILAVGAIGAVAIDRGRFRWGARLIAAATALDELFLTALGPDERSGFATSFDKARQALGDEDFARATAVGEAMMFDQAVASALEDEGTNLDFTDFRSQ